MTQPLTTNAVWFPPGLWIGNSMMRANVLQRQVEEQRAEIAAMKQTILKLQEDVRLLQLDLVRRQHQQRQESRLLPPPPSPPLPEGRPSNPSSKASSQESGVYVDDTGICWNDEFLISASPPCVRRSI